MTQSDPFLIAIIGAGPAALFMYKKLVEAEIANLEVHIYERKNVIGAGMPYSNEGSEEEHITNISDHEFPDLVTSLTEWVHGLPDSTLATYNISRNTFKETEVVPRLLFGQYLKEQFEALIKTGRSKGIKTSVFLNREVTNIVDIPTENKVLVEVEKESVTHYDSLVICSGHNWASDLEDKIMGYYNSPYPPAKLKPIHNKKVAIRGSSLTSFDAIRTMARANGSFHENEDQTLTYQLSESCPDFRMVLHSRNGLLPAVRHYLEDPMFLETPFLTRQQIQEHIDQNNGFLSLDYMFEKNFKDRFITKDPEFYRTIKDLNVESFVEMMMGVRERIDPFILFRAEFQEARKSQRRRKSIQWKEMLVVLSYAMNYPAKYLSAEDMLRYQKTLAPLISIVIAASPPASCLELLALHEAGILEIVTVGNNSIVKPVDTGGVIYKYTNEEGQPIEYYFQVFVDCVGQRQLSVNDLPFQGLIDNKTVNPAYIRFKSREEGEKLMLSGENPVVVFPSGEYYLKVSGMGINDYFQVLDPYGVPNERIFIMAVPYIGGYNPDYSGLDFCDAASDQIVKRMISSQGTPETDLSKAPMTDSIARQNENVGQPITPPASGKV